MSLRQRCGQAVMIVMMGAMVVAGIVTWLSKGDVHMMGMHGGKHAKDEKAAVVSGETHGGHHESPSTERPEPDGERSNGKR